MEATIKELRTHTKDLIDTVSQGEEIIITYQGKPYAKLVPFDVEEVQEDEKGHHLFGIWKDRMDMLDVDEYVKTLRRGRFS